MAERTREEKVRLSQGLIGEHLVARSDLLRGLVPRGCRVVNGHEPAIPFSNLQEVKHLDFIVVDPKSKAICAICEVKTTITRSKKVFPMNGKCGDVMARAQKAGIPIFLAIVRLKRALPDSTDTPESFGGLNLCTQESCHLRAGSGWGERGSSSSGTSGPF